MKGAELGYSFLIEEVAHALVQAVRFRLSSGLDSWLDDQPSRACILPAYLPVRRRTFPFGFRHAVWSLSLLGSDVFAVSVDRGSNLFGSLASKCRLTRRSRASLGLDGRGARPHTSTRARPLPASNAAPASARPRYRPDGKCVRCAGRRGRTGDLLPPLPRSTSSPR